MGSLMKLYTSMGPNPRMVHLFLREKGMELPEVQVDLMGAENRAEAYLAKNPAGQLPALELDDGRFLGETVAICEYLEEKKPEPPLIGRTPEERAETRMWQRRVELNITEHLYNGFRYAEGRALFESRMRVLPEAADGLKAIVRDKLAWIDGLLAGKKFIAGDRLTLADLILFAALEFGQTVGQPIPQGRPHLQAWYDRMTQRPSVQAA